MTARDRLEQILRSWNGYETGRGATPVIDYDIHPPRYPAASAAGRIEVLNHLNELSNTLQEDEDPALTFRIAAETTYLRALLGERLPVAAYVEATQGCPAAGWTNDYIENCGEVLRQRLGSLDIKWDENLRERLETAEGRVAAEDAPDAIRTAARDLEPLVRAATGATAEFALDIVIVNDDVYWSYWLDGSRQESRLRINLRNARFTTTTIRQFALHEILGHALQYACYAAEAASGGVPWVRLLTLHSPQQLLLEGLAQALPLLVVPDDEELRTRVMLDHYQQLIYGELHLAINNGTPADDCMALARSRAPFWSDSAIEGTLADRSNNPQLRSYLWSYSAGLDWFTSLAQTRADIIREVLHAAYRAPLSPGELRELWASGPLIGGNKEPLRLR